MFRHTRAVLFGAFRHKEGAAKFAQSGRPSCSVFRDEGVTPRRAIILSRPKQKGQRPNKTGGQAARVDAHLGGDGGNTRHLKSASHPNGAETRLQKKGRPRSRPRSLGDTHFAWSQTARRIHGSPGPAPSGTVVKTWPLNRRSCPAPTLPSQAKLDRNTASRSGRLSRPNGLGRPSFSKFKN
jgi:hypothetical protein